MREKTKKKSDKISLCIRKRIIKTDALLLQAQLKIEMLTN
ncbi:Hypothetical Protein U712_03800 [Bacillus subtilis PY79]|nr:Hypothetical Protein U712_03800 [Bacillus subtilis PY79]AKN12827.1 hypothetical protein ABU16_1751 [Bacillus subtilis]EHA29296.1 hypothetical protein BSSC8_35760 [Bacillus subtilis subsp. subtilis str. SC-8]EME08970.1 hypothetical protein BS732_1291 [Bacillus subtilis MB73/2]KZD80176.1 hypothetical protein B4417_2637 [Bacillus subtilis]